MRNTLIGKVILNDNGYELIKEHPSTSNEWKENEIVQIRHLLNSGLDELRGNEAIETYYFLMK